GRPPFAGDAVDIIPRVQRGDFPPPRAIDPSIDRALEAVCLKAMALRPEDRYGSWRGAGGGIERWMARRPGTGRGGPPARAAPAGVMAGGGPLARRARRWARRRRTAVAAALVAMAAGVVGLGAVAGVQARANQQLRAANHATALALAETKEAKKATDTALGQS